MLPSILSKCCWFFMTFVWSGMLFAGVTIYPAPGDLDAVQHLKPSTDYTLTVNGKSCFVYESENYWVYPKGGGRRPQTKVAFTSFALGGEKVVVGVTCNFAVKTVTIRPLSAGVIPSISGNTITFALSTPKKISVEVNDQKKPLLIVAESPDVPDTAATYYYGPGVHKIGTKKEIKAGERVYIAGGAVVEGTFHCSGENIKIRGRGILSAGHITWDAWRADSHLCMFDYPKWLPKDQEFEGLFLLNSPGWYCRAELVNSTVKNVKFIAWAGNSDALHLGGNSLMEDCLCFINDDCLIGNNGSNNTWRNCVVWKGNWGRPIISLLANRGTIQGFLWEDIDIIGFDWKEPVIKLTQNATQGNGGTMENYVIRNIRVESPRICPLIDIKANNFTIKNILLEKITTSTTVAEEGKITASGTGSVAGVEFRNLRLDSEWITNFGTAKISTNGAVSGVTFTTSPPRRN
ncbi:MAG: hypothetical protein WCO56_16010 [Verrucomicrobiota bacterium]